MTVRNAFRDQAVHCDRLGSPFMASLMTLCADRLTPGTAVADRMLAWPGDARAQADSVPLRFAGALHALRIEGLALGAVYPPEAPGDDALWASVEAAMVDFEPRILTWLDSAPQTNEVRRAAAILPALAHLNEMFDRPVALFELGASGGLNLRADRFLLDAGSRVLGDTESAVTLSPEWHGDAPRGIVPEVLHRSGVDLNPLDPNTDAGRLRLLAYLWPDQPDRIARTEAAIAIANAHPAVVEADDAGAWLERALATQMPGTLRVVYHTIAWQYFPEATVKRVNVALALAAKDATRDAPLAHLSVEADGGRGAAIMLTTWPTGEVTPLGRADFHGRWIDWNPPAR